MKQREQPKTKRLVAIESDMRSTRVCVDDIGSHTK